MAYASAAEVVEDVQKFVAEHIGETHPVIFLRARLSSKAEKENLAKLMVPKLVGANPSMLTHLSPTVSADRATQDAGDAGVAHALMLSFEGVAGSPLDAFQRGLAPPAKIYEVLYRSLEEGLDTSARSLQLAISRSSCDVPISKKIFFAGYCGGSSLGFAQSLAMYITTQLPKDSSAALAKWLKSISEMRVAWMVPMDALGRVFKSMGTPIPLSGERR